MTSLLDALTLARFARSSSMAVIVRLFTCGGSRESAAVSSQPLMPKQQRHSKIVPLTFSRRHRRAEDRRSSRVWVARTRTVPAPVGTSSSEFPSPAAVLGWSTRVLRKCQTGPTAQNIRSIDPKASTCIAARISAERGRGGEEIRRRGGRIGTRGVRERHAWSRYDGFRRGRGRVVRSRGARRRRQGAQRSGGAQFLSSRSPSFALRLSISRRRV